MDENETPSPPALKPSSLEDLQRSREIVAAGPSGNVYRLRPLNLERHALAGGLPARLRQIAMEGAKGLEKLFEGPQAELEEQGGEVRGYLDGLVRQVIVEPELPDDLDVLPPVDYQWAVAIAMGEEDRDGEGRLLWGREPLSRWDTFRHFHGCDADCDGCRGVQDRFSAALAGSRRAVAA